MFRFSFLLISIAMHVLGQAPANASTVQKVRFAQAGVVVVWDERGNMKRGAEVQLGNQFQASPANYVGSGFLEPVQATYTGANQMTVKVASNTPVRIEATSVEPVSHVMVDVVGIGKNASLLGPRSQVTNGMISASPREIYRTEDKTARTKGSAESQAITLQISWSGDASPVINIAVLD